MEIMETAKNGQANFLFHHFLELVGSVGPVNFRKNTMNFENDLGVSIWLSESHSFSLKKKKGKSRLLKRTWDLYSIVWNS